MPRIALLLLLLPCCLSAQEEVLSAFQDTTSAPGGGGAGISDDFDVDFGNWANSSILSGNDGSFGSSSSPTEGDADFDPFGVSFGATDASVDAPNSIVITDQEWACAFIETSTGIDVTALTNQEVTIRARANPVPDNTTEPTLIHLYTPTDSGSTWTDQGNVTLTNSFADYTFDISGISSTSVLFGIAMDGGLDAAFAGTDVEIDSIVID